jgi:antitoxin HicB
MESHNKHLGTSLDDFLQEEGILEQTEAVALKRMIAYQISELLKRENITQTELAKRMNTSKAAISRLLNPINAAVTLQTLLKAAHALGKKINFSLD